MKRWIISAFTIASMAIIAWPAGSAFAAIDITGAWNFSLTHPDLTGTITCSATVTQTGTNVSVPMSCSMLGSGTLTGTIDTSAGTFNLAGTLGSGAANFAGQASLDGNSANGLWVYAGIPVNGTFFGTRTPAVGGLTELASSAAAAAGTSDRPDTLKPGVMLLMGIALGGGIAATALARRTL